MLGILSDITERKIAEAALAVGRRFSDSLNRINEAVHSSLDSKEIMDKLVEEGVIALKCETGAILLRTENGWTASHVFGMDKNIVGRKANDEQELHAVMAIRTGLPVAVEDAFNDDRFNRENFRQFNVRSVLVTPLVVHGEPFGVIFFNYHSKIHSFNEQEVNFARQLAATASIALENARLFGERRQAEAALLESEQQLRLAIEYAPIPVIMHAEDGEVLYISHTWTDLTGYRKEDIRSFNEWTGNAVYGEGANDVRDYLKSLFSSSRVEFPILTRTGQLRYWSFSASAPGYLRDGRRFVIGMALDITERRRAENAVHEAKDELESRVLERTEELSRIVSALEDEIKERKRAEDEIQKNQHALRGLAAELQLAEERERRRIAQDLHDSICQILAFSTRELRALEKSLPAETTKSVDEIASHLSSTLEQARTLSFDLSPGILYDLGFEAALEELVEEMSKQSNIKCRFENTGMPKPLADDVKILLYRSIRELIINAAKHAEADSVKVSLFRSSSDIYVKVEDDGKGFDVSAIYDNPGKPKGFGLLSIRERLDHIGGQLKFESAPGNGTKAILIAPLEIDGNGSDD